jgi:hypothetical protein
VEQSAAAELDRPEVGPDALPATSESSPTPETHTPAVDREVASRWLPPMPSDSDSDWIQTTSGEWLKGELTRLRDRRLEFDSDEFDDVEIDQEDVAFFRLSRPHTYRFRGTEIMRGTGELREGVIKIRTLANEVFERDAAALVSISRSAGGELERWTADVGLGATLRQGNTEQTEFSGSADIRRETALTRVRLDYTGTWTEVEGSNTANNHRASAALDYFISWRFFVTLPSFEYFTDEFQNIKARYTPGLGVGYEIVDTPRVEWDVTGSVAYQRTIFETGSDAADDAALIFGTDLELEITKDLDWDSSYAVQLVVTDLDKTNHHAESKLSFDVWGPVDFDLTFIWDRIENPETESDGSTPKRDDFRMTVGLAIDF